MTSLTSGIVACWPLNEGSGTSATDIVGGGVLNCGGSGVSWNASPLGLITLGAPSRATLATPSYLKIQQPFSMMWLGNIGSTLAGDGGFCGVHDTSGTTGYYLITRISSNDMATLGNASIVYFGTISVATGACNLISRFGNSQPGVSASETLNQYVNGTSEPIAGPTGTFGTISYGGSTEFYLGSEPNESPQSDLRHDLVVIWNRFLTATEIAALNSNPWQIFVSAVPFPAALLPAM